ncbi:unnamed protein product [Lactuca virosa]|uniref:Uncharacterized protein n=1 Tax=Lactuca virosa TaxID=75947 RepID=A0AAU9PGN2_9ASTR|nr:unnamed protein product [Lactuca virosa]
MKSSVFTLVLLSIFLYPAQGIRFEKSSMSPSNHQQLIAKISSSNKDDGSSTTKLSPGFDRKLMTEMITSRPINSNSKNYKNNNPDDMKFTHGEIGKGDIFPTTFVPANDMHEKTEVLSHHQNSDVTDIIDITQSDYTPRRCRTPIHNC